MLSRIPFLKEGFGFFTASPYRGWKGIKLISKFQVVSLLIFNGSAYRSVFLLQGSFNIDNQKIVLSILRRHLMLHCHDKSILIIPGNRIFLLFRHRNFRFFPLGFHIIDFKTVPLVVLYIQVLLVEGILF